MAQTLKALFTKLDARQEAISLAELEAELKTTDLQDSDFRRTATFGERTYRRNLLHEGPNYHALVLCWRPGQRG